MQIDGRRLRFRGDILDYLTLCLKNTVFTVITLGIYAILGFSERNIAKFIDENIEWDEEMPPYL